MIDFDAADPDAPYDPDPLTLGDRVRYRHRGECRIAGSDWTRVDGKKGIVVAVRPQSLNGHSYGVQIPEHGMGWCARVELERIPAQGKRPDPRFPIPQPSPRDWVAECDGRGSMEPE